MFAVNFSSDEALSLFELQEENTRLRNLLAAANERLDDLEWERR